MRVLLGIILGGVLTVGGAYLYDSHNALSAANATTNVQQPLVNWDVVGDQMGAADRARPRRMDPARRLNSAAATESTLRSHAGA